MYKKISLSFGFIFLFSTISFLSARASICTDQVSQKLIEVTEALTQKNIILAAQKMTEARELLATCVSEVSQSQSQSQSTNSFVEGSRVKTTTNNLKIRKTPSSSKDSIVLGVAPFGSLGTIRCSQAVGFICPFIQSEYIWWYVDYDGALPSGWSAEEAPGEAGGFLVLASTPAPTPAPGIPLPSPTPAPTPAPGITLPQSGNTTPQSGNNSGTTNQFNAPAEFFGFTSQTIGEQCVPIEFYYSNPNGPYGATGGHLPVTANQISSGWQQMKSWVQPCSAIAGSKVNAFIPHYDPNSGTWFYIPTTTILQIELVMALRGVLPSVEDQKRRILKEAGECIGAPKVVCDIYTNSRGAVGGLSWGTNTKGKQDWIETANNPKLIFWGPANDTFLVKGPNEFQKLTTNQVEWLIGTPHEPPASWIGTSGAVPFDPSTATGLSWDKESKGWVSDSTNPQMVYWGPTGQTFLGTTPLTNPQLEWLLGVPHGPDSLAGMPSIGI